MLVSLLELVVPLVEVDVENDNGPGGKSSHQESEMTMLWNAQIKQYLDKFSRDFLQICSLLVVGESKTSDAGVASRESVEERQIERPPHLNYIFFAKIHSPQLHFHNILIKEIHSHLFDDHLDNAFVSSRHHVLSVSWNEHALQNKAIFLWFVAIYDLL